MISTRPKTWNDIVGQDRAVKVLKSILTTSKYMPRGYIFGGHYGVGKTTVAYIYAQALMCTGSDPLGCSTCSSCETINSGISNHPDFMEIDGASTSGVQDARELIQNIEALPVLGRRRVIMVDEAHRLSPEAWDVYLKPLEQPENGVFIFITNSVDKIPVTIRSRCLRLNFPLISADLILGRVLSVANTYSIPYEMDALRTIAKGVGGHLRDALQVLNAAGSMGKVTKSVVDEILCSSLEDECLQIYMRLLTQPLKESVAAMDNLSLNNLPARIIETMFALYGKIMLGVEPPLSDWEKMVYAEIKSGYRSITGLTSLFLKWSSTPNIPADALALFVEEVDSCRRGNYKESIPLNYARPEADSTEAVETYYGRPRISLLRAKEIATILGGNLTEGIKVK